MPQTIAGSGVDRAIKIDDRTPRPADSPKREHLIVLIGHENREETEDTRGAPFVIKHVSKGSDLN